MHLGHQRAGGVEDAQPAPFGLGAHRLRHAVGAENHRGAFGYLVEFLDEHRALGAQVLHHELVMHDLVAHVDGCAVQRQRPLDDLDGALDAGAEAAGIGEQNVHHRMPITSTSNRMALPARGWLKSISASVPLSSRTRPV